MLYFLCCNFTSFDPILASSSLNKTVSPYLSGNTSFKVLPQVILKLVGGQVLLNVYARSLRISAQPLIRQ